MNYKSNLHSHICVIESRFFVLGGEFTVLNRVCFQASSPTFMIPADDQIIKKMKCQVRPENEIASHQQ